ncbi:MAG: hypothetical protein AB7F65_04985 [Dehalococcoidia bacterium]
MARSTSWLIGVVAVVAALAVVAVVVATMSGETELEDGTPEAAVQAYLRAVADRDSEAAYAWFSSELRERCSVANVRDALQYGPPDFRAALGDVITRDGTTDVFVDVTQRYEGDLLGSESSFSQVFSLTQEDGAWRFVDDPWPVWCPVEPLR